MNLEYKIPSAIIHGGGSLEYRQSVFLEVAQKYIKLLFVTPERFVMSSFHNFFVNIIIELCMMLQFVIDKGHCPSNDYFNNIFRKCCGQIPGVYKERYHKFLIAIASDTIANEFDVKLKQQLNLTKPLLVLDKVVELQCNNLKFSICKRQRKCSVDAMTHVETHQGDRGIEHSGFPDNEILIYDKLTEKLILPLRFFMYHSQLFNKEKDNFEKWRTNSNGFMICIGRFGMGIDVPNEKFILRDRSLFTVIDYVQESGCFQPGNEIG